MLNCPFCGSGDIDAKFWTSEAASGPGCMNCGATADSVAQWNTRHAFEDAQIAAAVAAFKDHFGAIDRNSMAYEDALKVSLVKAMDAAMVASKA